MAEMQFTETALLMAFLEEDRDRAVEIARGMLPNERRTLAEQAGAMQTLLESFCDACDQPIPPGGAEEGVPWGQRGITEWKTSTGERRQFHQECAPEDMSRRLRRRS
jgi:hypothetical protein